MTASTEPRPTHGEFDPYAYTQKFYIGGQWVDAITSETLDVLDPATEVRIATVSIGSEADVDAAVGAAADAFDAFSTTPVAARVELLRKVAAVYERHSDEFAELISAELGAPISLARGEQVSSGLEHINATITALERFEFADTVGSSMVLHEPIGVCALITPWNWPLNQIAAKVAPALAAGCTMVLKPSEVAPLNALLFVRVLEEAGVPPGVFNLVNGDGPTVGAALSAHPYVAMVSFTGSTRAGVEVARNAAPGVKRVTQELGGKSANIVLDDADFPSTITREVAGAYLNSGQSCDAGTRLLVPAHRMDEVIKLARAATEAVIVGAPSDESTEVGPLVSRAQFDRVQSLIRVGEEEGAAVVAGGPGRPPGLESGFYVRPTVLAEVENSTTVAREEIFGPVLVLIGYQDEDDAVRIANDSPYGLSGMVSSPDLDRARDVARRLRTGMVHINGAPLDYDAPFGGYKTSGNGREYGAHGIREFLEVKSIFGYDG